jgi:hypothetical protein
MPKPTESATEELMRIKIVMLTLGALAMGAFATGPFVHPATAAKTKLGCERGKETWDASIGKCVPGKPKKVAKKAAKK